MKTQQVGRSLLRSCALPPPPNLAPSLFTSVSPCPQILISRSLPRAYSKSFISKCAIHGHSTVRNASSATATKAVSDEQDELQTAPPSYRQASQKSSENIKQQNAFLDRLQNNQSSSISKPVISDESQDLYASILGNTTDGSKTQNPAVGPESTVDYMERRFGQTSRRRAQRPDQNYVAKHMKFPEQSPAVSIPTPDALKYSGLYEQPTRAQSTIKSHPSVGRTVEVMPNRGMDLGRAIRALEINCSVNNVKQDAYQQRFYERPGMKRKRLKSARWRKRFKEGFQAVVGKVKIMRRKGW